MAADTEAAAVSDVAADSPNASEKPVSPRLWPGVLLPGATFCCMFLPGILIPATLAQFMLMMAGSFGGALLTLLWWLGLSRLPLRDRLTIFGVFVAGLALVLTLGDQSMVLGSFFAFPSVVLAGTMWLAGSAGWAWPARRQGAMLVVAAGWLLWLMVRVDGLDGTVWPTLSWRWSQTAEQKYLASLETGARPSNPPGPARGDESWTGFRGPQRDGHARGVAISTDWKDSPPAELWRRRVGPNWSSYAVVNGELFTQEQRGEDEVVHCLNAATGAEVWAHKTPARFWEAIGGTGPRATPTVDQGRVYALGAKGSLVCLEAKDGTPVWSRDIAEDGQAKVPDWGFASSPLVVDGKVVVFAGGDKDNSVLAYRADSGELAWSGGSGAHTYSSPHLAELGGQPQILMVTEAGIQSLDIASGEVLWNHDWPVPAYRVVQPMVVEDGVLLGTMNNMGTRRLRVTRDGDQWQVETVWTSKRLKPYFNDFVVHEGHVYGLDHSILICLDLKDGAVKWKGGRFGTGQLLLIPDQDLLLITTEKTGEVVLMAAEPSKPREVARFEALSGKTWNHPVVAGGRLYVRNGEEAACFDVAP